jgi:hypothetical protein
MAQSNGHLAKVARTYADDGAQAERQYAEDVATATRDHWDTWYHPARQNALNATAATRNATVEGLENAYAMVEANALADSLRVEADARQAYVLAQAPADETLAVAKAQAERDYRLVELDAFGLLVQAELRRNPPGPAERDWERHTLGDDPPGD